MTTSIKINKIVSILRKKEFFIFDYDGVIADSVKIKTTAFKELYKIYGKKIQIKVANFHKKNGGMSRKDKFKYFHNNFLNKKISHKQIDTLSKKFSNIVFDKIVSSNEIKGVNVFLKKNFEKKIFLINSATPKNELKRIIKKRKEDKYFKHIYGSPKTKVHNIKNILNKFKTNKEKFIFFGDASQDLKASIECGIDFVYLKKNKIKLPKNEIKVFFIKNFDDLNNE